MLLAKDVLMDFIRKHYKLILYLIPVLSLALHWYVFPIDLVGIHVWRQTETQQVIDNFYREDMNIFHPRVNNMSYPGRLLLLEFPVMQWIFSLFFKAFGPYVIISRVLSFIIGLCSIYGIFYLACHTFKDKAVAAISAWCFSFSPVFHYYTVCPMPDNFSMCFAIWSIGMFYRYIMTEKLKYVLWSATFLSIAIMAKLPFILYGIFIVGYFFIALKNRQTSLTRIMTIAAIYTAFATPALLWYAYAMHTWKGMVVLKGILDVKQSNIALLKIFIDVFVSVLPELLINYGSVLFFIAGFYFIAANKAYKKEQFVMFFAWGAIIILYFIFEMNTITAVHDYYMLPVLPPMFLLIGYGSRHLLTGKNKFLRSLSFFCLAILPLLAFIRTYSRWDVATDTGFSPVFYKYKKEIRRLTPANALCVVGGDQSDMVLLYYIDRKGWSYNGDQLDSTLLSLYRKDGAAYLYSASHVDNDRGVRVQLDEKIFDKENLTVYKLK